MIRMKIRANKFINTGMGTVMPQQTTNRLSGVDAWGSASDIYQLLKISEF